MMRAKRPGATARSGYALQACALSAVCRSFHGCVVVACVAVCVAQIVEYGNNAIRTVWLSEDPSFFTDAFAGGADKDKRG